MAPSKIRTRTLRDLRKTFLAMMSPAWDMALDGKTNKEVTEAARALLAVQRARLRLGNAELADIRDGLKANEAELAVGGRKLAGALDRLHNVKAVLAATSAVLRTVARVVDIVV